MPNSEANIGREETKQRRDLAKAFHLAVKGRAKGTPWRFAQGVLFRDLGGWFVSAPVGVWLGRRKTTIEIFCKPMALDPVFWEIVEAESNSALPLSFRHSGAWTCCTPAIFDRELDESVGDPDAIARDAMAWLNEHCDQLKFWSVEHFLQRLQQHPRSSSFLATVVTTMFLVGDYGTAETLCNDAIGRGDACGFSISRNSGPSQSFPELALAWLNRKRAWLR